MDAEVESKSDKCAYCGQPIERGQEVLANSKRDVITGLPVIEWLVHLACALPYFEMKES